MQRQLDVGKARGDSRQDPRQNLDFGGRHDADRQRPHLAGVGPHRGLDRTVGMIQDLAGFAQECPARDRELNPPIGALQQLDPDVTFKPTNLLAERRLRGAEPRRGAREVQLFRDRHEVAQVTQFHGVEHTCRPWNETREI